METQHLTKTIASLIREAQATGAEPDLIRDLWELRALPVEQQLRRLPEWLQVRDEWRQAVATAR